jgi:hypothetical protein
MGRYDVDGEPIGLPEIERLELHTGFHQVRNECHIASEPVELRNDQLGAMQSAQVEGFGEFGAIGTLAALDLGKLGDQFPVPALR